MNGLAVKIGAVLKKGLSAKGVAGNGFAGLGDSIELGVFSIPLYQQL